MAGHGKQQVRHPELADRMKETMARGRWSVQGLVDEMKQRSVQVTYEMARRYKLGQAMPRPEKMGVLADILGVSPSYLQYGHHHSPAGPDSSQRAPAAAFYPFLRVRPEDYAALADDTKADIERIIESHLHGCPHGGVSAPGADV